MIGTVTVAIVTHNHAAFVRDCVESVARQERSGVDVVCLDDASTDGTRAVLQSLAREHPWLHLIFPDGHLGVTGACNEVLRHCRGDYVSWLAGDDLMLPGKLEMQRSLLDARGDVTLCYHDLAIFRSATGRVLYHLNSGPGSRPAHQGAGAGDLVRFGGCFNGASATMTRRRAHPERGFDPRLPIASDWLFFIETAAQGGIAFEPRVLGAYRLHEANTSRANDLTEQKILTLDIVAERLPELQRDVAIGKARIHTELAMRALRRGSMAACVARMTRGAREDPKSTMQTVLRELSRRLARQGSPSTSGAQVARPVA